MYRGTIRLAFRALCFFLGKITASGTTMTMTKMMAAATKMEMHHLRRDDDFVRAMRCDFHDCSHDSSKEKIKIEIKAKD
jgi:hypothetical protein